MRGGGLTLPWSFLVAPLISLPFLPCRVTCAAPLLSAGAKHRDEIYQAFEQIYPVLQEFRKGMTEPAAEEAEEAAPMEEDPKGKGAAVGELAFPGAALHLLPPLFDPFSAWRPPEATDPPPDARCRAVLNRARGGGAFLIQPAPP